MCFTKIVELMSNNAHLKTEGLHKIINIKASMNLGLSDVLKSEFINITPVDRPIILTKIIPEPNWLTGFVSGEGCFLIKISKSNSHKIGYQVWLEFSITQHERDKKLMWLISKYLGCGKIYKDSRPRSPVCYFRIIKFKDIQNKLIPFFEKYPLIGVKQLDYLDWCKVAILMSKDSHLTLEGLEQICNLKCGMNKGRKN